MTNTVTVIDYLLCTNHYVVTYIQYIILSLFKKKFNGILFYSSFLLFYNVFCQIYICTIVVLQCLLSNIYIYVYIMYNCFITLVPIFSCCSSLPAPPILLQHQPPPHCPCPRVIYTCSLTRSFPFFPLLSASSLPPGHCQPVPCFLASGSILLVCLFCSLGSSYR